MSQSQEQSRTAGFSAETVTKSFQNPSQYSKKARATRVNTARPKQPKQEVPPFKVGIKGGFALKSNKYDTLYAFQCNSVHANLVVLDYSVSSPKGPITGSMCVVRRRSGTSYNLMANLKAQDAHTHAFVGDFHQMNTKDMSPVMHDGTTAKVSSRTIADMIIGLTLHCMAS